MKSGESINLACLPVWEKYMTQALNLARLAWAMNEIPVGALVVNAGGESIGHGYNSPIHLNDPTAHAEMLALRSAAKNVGNYRLSGCVLIVTLEPCPMCLAAIAHARLHGVVFGARDSKKENPGTEPVLKKIHLLNHNFNIFGPVLTARCEEVLNLFFQHRRHTKMPSSLHSFIDLRKESGISHLCHEHF